MSSLSTSNNYGVITRNNGFVESARFCGGQCQDVVFGDPGHFSYDQAMAIRRHCILSNAHEPGTVSLAKFFPCPVSPA